jgi:hypothetical protein
MLQESDAYQLPAPEGLVTAPITEWLTTATQVHLSDVFLEDGHVVRAVWPALALEYLREGGIVLPRRAS